MGKCVYSRESPKQYTWVKETNSKYKAHCWPCNNTSIQMHEMGESAVRSQVQGEGHYKRNKKKLCLRHS